LIEWSEENRNIKMKKIHLVLITALLVFGLNIFSIEKAEAGFKFGSVSLGGVSLSGDSGGGIGIRTNTGISIGGNTRNKTGSISFPGFELGIGKNGGFFSIGTLGSISSIKTNCGATAFCGGGTEEAKAIISQGSKGISTESDLKKLVGSYLNWGLGFLGLLAVVALIWAGILYIGSATDEGNAEKAKNIIKWVVVGILVILISYALVNTLITGVQTGAS